MERILESSLAGSPTAESPATNAMESKGLTSIVSNAICRTSDAFNDAFSCVGGGNAVE